MDGGDSKVEAETPIGENCEVGEGVDDGLAASFARVRAAPGDVKEARDEDVQADDSTRAEKQPWRQ